MPLDLTTLDAHEQPSQELKATWKKYSRTDHADFICHPDIDELDLTKDVGAFHLEGHIPREKLISSFNQLEDESWDEAQVSQDAPFYSHPLVPGQSTMRRLKSMTVFLILDYRPAHIPFSNTPEHAKSASVSDAS